ncbi:MAG TPA: SDR family oxidoreductase [Planktothrix sp.]
MSKTSGITVAVWFFAMSLQASFNSNEEAMKTAIITGGGRGIGKAIAKRLAHEYRVLIVGRTEADLNATAEEIRAQGGVCEIFVGDISKTRTAERCLKVVRNHGWQLDTLVANAGIGHGGKTETVSKKSVRDSFTVNVLGNFWFMQESVKLMLEQGKGGSICVISSILGVKGYGHQAAYTASKHALVGMAKSIGLEHGKNGINVYPLCPSFVESDMTDRVIRGVMEREGLNQKDARRKVANKNPQKRIIPAEEVAEMVAFLCSRKVTSLNANPLIMSGGE